LKIYEMFWLEPKIEDENWARQVLRTRFWLF
jgi:hypothetical protein